MGHDTGLNIDPGLANPGQGVTIDDADRLGMLAAYWLKKGSPLIDAGLNLRELFALDSGPADYFSNPIPRGMAFDIGAHEWADTAK